MELLSITPEIYDERHVQDLIGSEVNGGLHRKEGHTGALYNPAIPIDPPKVCACSVRVHFIQRKDLLRSLFGCMSFVRCMALGITGINPSLSLGYVPRYHWDASLIIVGVCPSVSLGYAPQYPSLSITGIHPRIRPSVSLPTEVYSLHHSKLTFPYSVTL